METNKQDKVINLNLINISPRLGKLNEHHWIGFAVFVFAITPFIFSFYFKRIPVFIGYNLLETIVLSILMQIPVLIIGMPLYYIYKKIKYPEKISERRYEFRILDYKTVHFFMSSFWMSGFFGVIAFIICLIFKLSQTTYVLAVYVYMLLRLLIMLPIYYYNSK